MKGKMKVVLVVANYAWFGKRPWRGVTTSVPIITAVLKDKFHLEVLDANVNEYGEEEVRERLKASAADVVLITALSAEYFKTYHAVAAISKEVLPDATVIMGGVYPTVCPEHVMEDKNIDFAMLGHAEERLDCFLSMIERKDGEGIRKFEGIAYRGDGGGKCHHPVKALYRGRFPDGKAGLFPGGTGQIFRCRKAQHRQPKYGA